MNKSTALRSTSQAGFSAIPAQHRFCVIEGGRARSQTHQIAMSHASQKATARRVRHPHARKSIDVRPQPRTITTRTHAVVALTVALAFVILSLTWRLTDVLAEHRVQQALAQVEYQTIVVHSGDTLWRIAEEHAVRGCSTEELVYHIRALNDVQNAYLIPGMRLTVPQS